FIYKLDGVQLVAGGVDLEHPNAGAVVDGGELIQSRARAGDALEELHVQLESVTWLRLFVTRPAGSVGPILLVARQAAHAMLAQNAVDGGRRDRHGMKALQVVGNHARAEVVVLPQIQNLADDLP